MILDVIQTSSGPSLGFYLTFLRHPECLRSGSLRQPLRGQERSFLLRAEARVVAGANDVDNRNGVGNNDSDESKIGLCWFGGDVETSGKGHKWLPNTNRTCARGRWPDAGEITTPTYREIRIRNKGSRHEVGSLGTLREEDCVKRHGTYPRSFGVRRILTHYYVFKKKSSSILHNIATTAGPEPQGALDKEQRRLHPHPTACKALMAEEAYKNGRKGSGPHIIVPNHRPENQRHFKNQLF
ncbi:hypothetical protein WH47_07716 [Habropoda laboriosa]|uniref:Uncharacterized protein n=1 Tax=Habropoda laboriosa TaxID=597456 RepID=A0A0L7QQ68_9HYME|nr:hypothetical protein WH47_07716 [Habropoda laboriosa]